MKTATHIALITLLASVSSTPVLADNTEHLDKKELLLTWMQGHFDSEQQSIADKEFYNIHLNMAAMWTADPEHWLYVEQAAATHLDEPYRQRVYQVMQVSETEFASKVYGFNNDKHYAGAYKSPNPLAELTPKDLVERQGCTVYLTWSAQQQHFAGSTKDKQCLSQLRGASYATSEVVVTKDKIVSWDRGFDSNDQQVWGAVKGGYEFIKAQ